MDNVTQLPDRPVREWLVLEKKLRVGMATLKAPPDMIDYLCVTLRPVFLECAYVDFVIDYSGGPDEVTKQVNQFYQQYSHDMFMQIIHREIELYSLRGK